MLGLERWVSPSLVTALLVVGCGRGDRLDSSETPGELGNGAFRYLCVETRDAVCPSGGQAQTFPERIGTTGVFDVRFEEFAPNSVVAFDITPSTTDIVGEENDLF